MQDPVTLDELEQYVWRRLGVRRAFVRRRQVDRLTRLSVQHFAGQECGETVSDQEQHDIARATFDAVKANYQEAGQQEYGFVIWVWLLTSVLSAVIQVIIKWWLERRRNRTLLLVWQQDLQQEAAR